MTWKSYGACRGVTDINFFPESKKGRWADSPAKALCQTCFVRAQCLDYALEHDEKGIWGGTNETDRKKIQDRYVRLKSLDRPVQGVLGF